MKKEKVISRRLDYIDIAKGIGIIAVMLSHGVEFPGNTEYYFTAYCNSDRNINSARDINNM